MLKIVGVLIIVSAICFVVNQTENYTFGKCTMEKILGSIGQLPSFDQLGKNFVANIWVDCILSLQLPSMSQQNARAHLYLSQVETAINNFNLVCSLISSIKM